MNPTGAADPLYVLARRVLLDALEALGPQRHALTLAGAQAVYMHTGPGGLAVSEYTTEARASAPGSAERIGNQEIQLDVDVFSSKPLLDEPGPDLDGIELEAGFLQRVPRVV